MNYLSGTFSGGFTGGGGVSSSLLGLQGRVQALQAQLFPICPATGHGLLSNFLTKGIKTNQLEVNTDEKTLRPVARLREPRDLFALPKEKDNDCSQQAARWPTECQVLDERISHINNVPPTPEPYAQPTGNEQRPRPLGEENGIVVYNYNPVSAVNYPSLSAKFEESEGSDTDISSSESRGSSPDRRPKLKNRFSKMFNNYQSSSNSDDNENENENDNDNSDDDDDEDEVLVNITSYQTIPQATVQSLHEEIKLELDKHAEKANKAEQEHGEQNEELEDIWGKTSPYYSASATKCVIQRVEAKPVPKETILPPKPQPQSARLQIVNNYNSHRCEPSCSNSISQFNSGPNCPLPPNSLSPSPPLPLPLTSQLLPPLSPAQSGDASFDSFDLAKSSLLINILNDHDCNYCPPLTQFSRSSVGGSKFLAQVHPVNPMEYDGLWFESRFESGNLAKAVKITDTYYELYLRPDMYTSRSRQWFYFRVSKTKCNVTYRFSIVNLVKSDSLYNDGMRPLMYSSLKARLGEGWRRCGENICYYRNDDENSNEVDEDNCSYTLTFNITFPYDDDTVYLAHSYPYTYSDLQDYLMAIQKHPIKSKFCKLRLLCRSLAGNNVYYLTVTAPTQDMDAMKKKKAIVVSARVHPSETPSSWMMKGLMDFITSESTVAKRLRHKFIFKLIPMLNPDGVIVGNTRNSLTGKDLNRQYRTVIRETYPSIWYTKAMVKRLIDECGVAMYCDMHAHSRRQNIFVYGCENRRNQEKKLIEQVFPLMLHKNVADKFSFEHCKFKVQRSKEGTGRIVVWALGVTNSYTLEASFGGSSLGSRKGTHFNTGDYETMGRAFCETLLDYCDENPNKERLRLKIIERLLKEGSSADEPLNIPLSDYSSDEGDTSSSSENEGKVDRFTDLEGPCCQPLKAPPCSPEHSALVARRKVRSRKKLRKSYNSSRFQKRVPIDMPTTDPGNEIFFSTDDENLTQADNNSGNNTISKSRRYLLQSDLQRRYIDTNVIGDCGPIQKMPPELIVTPANKGSTTTTSSTKHKKHKTLRQPPAVPTLAITEFPPVDGTLGRRTNSWHSLHSNSSTCSLQNPSIHNLAFTARSPGTKEFDFRKKVWNKACGPEVATCFPAQPRPLSLIMPLIKPNKDIIKERESQRTFFSVCSEKLMAWEHILNPKINVTVVEPDIPENKDIKTTSINDLDHKKKGTFDPIDTSRILHTIMSRNIPQLPLAANASKTLLPLTKSSSSTKHNVSNKFKTGGLVTTAVQTNKIKRQHQRNSHVFSVTSRQIMGTVCESTALQTDNGDREKEGNICRRTTGGLKPEPWPRRKTHKKINQKHKQKGQNKL